MWPGVLNSAPSLLLASFESISLAKTSLVNSANLRVVRLRSLSVIPVRFDDD